MGDGSVFTEDAGFKLLLGQTEEFPLLQVSLTQHSRYNLFCQDKHMSITPGKKHNVEVFGSQITTSRNPSTWKFEGRLICSDMGMADDFLQAF